MGRKKKRKSELLTPTELRVMQIIWEQGPSTVHEVKQKLSQDLQYEYNTVSTLMRVLEQKHFLKGEKQGRGFIYSPLVDRENYQSIGLNDVLENLFQGAPMGLIKGLLGNQKIKQEDLDEIKKLIKQMES